MYELKELKESSFNNSIAFSRYARRTVVESTPAVPTVLYREMPK